MKNQRVSSRQARATSQTRGQRIVQTALRGSSLQPNTYKRTNNLITLPLALNHSQLPLPVLRQQSYTYRIGCGNNGQLIETLLVKRGNWRLAGISQEPVNFKWYQTNWGYKYNFSQASSTVFNHLQFHKQMSNKQLLVRNLTWFCQANKQNAFEITPSTFIIDLHDQFLSLSLSTFIRFFNHNSPTKTKSKENIYLKKIRIIHPKSDSRRSQGNFYCRPILPQTFISDSYAWLLKPTFLNRGRGIHVFNDLWTLQRLINQYIQGKQQQKDGAPKQKQIKQDQTQQQQKQQQKSKQSQMKQSKEIKEPKEIKQPKESKQKSFIKQEQEKKKQNKIKALSFVIQKYIDRPLLINFRKFDVRIWVLITHRMSVYMFKQGYARTSCQCYSLDKQSLSNSFIHLTNNAIQKYSPDYQKFQDGNQLSFGYLDDYFRNQFRYPHFKTKTIKSFKEAIWLSVCSCKRKLNQRDRQFTFQIFGYDFLIDGNFKAWLIQINTNPCIQQSSPLLKMLIPRMLDDALKLTLDQIYPPAVVSKGPPVTGYSDDENMWQILGDLIQANRNALNKRFTFVKR